MGKEVIPGLDQETLEKLRAKHGSVRLGVIEIADPDEDAPRVIRFAFRRPRFKDSEVMASKARQNPAGAGRSLLGAVIVWPKPASEVLDALRDYPIALNTFVEGELLPFLGGDAEAESLEL